MTLVAASSDSSATAIVTGGLSTFDAVVLAAYLVAMLAMGFRIARKNESTEDFFVGGRDLPSWAVGISLIASLLSTITYLGMPSEMFRTGVGFLTRQLGLPIVLLITWFLWIPFFMRLRLTSAYEYLERRFNYPTRIMAASFCVCLLLGWMAVVVLTASGAMVEIANLQLGWFFSSDSADADMHAVILGIGLFSVLYTTLGGLRAVVWTDVVQFFVLLVGAFFTMGVIAWKTESGLGDWLTFSKGYTFEKVEWFSWDVTNRSTVFSISIGMLFWHACTHGANQVALQRYFSVKDVGAARRSFLVNALSSIGLGVLLAGVGLALMYFVLNDGFVSGDMLQTQEQLQSDDLGERTIAQKRVFPQFIRLYMPSGMRGLVIAALFAAAMSTIDSGANSISTIVTVDFLRRNRSETSTVQAELKTARILTASMGFVIVAVTIWLHHLSKETNIIDLCQRGFNCFLGPLGGLFVLAMFSRKATSATVIPAVLVGEAVGICGSYSKDLFGVEFSTHLVVPASWLATILLSHVLSLVFATRADELSQRWMWKPVVSGETDSLIE
ncbi:MAG: sodium/solute symporter [Planctomycetota bacterium]|nr:sodium/solute symporter [Planctomycetota bacterium]MDA0919393.1 sodium/solute symporter [Planctomycetota bacterium]MDA1158903.1 sodium/solute symporter [Planctomycetota bacterium]